MSGIVNRGQKCSEVSSPQLQCFDTNFASEKCVCGAVVDGQRSFLLRRSLERSFGQLPELSLPAPTFCRDRGTVRTETGDSGSFDVTLRRLVVPTTFRRDVDSYLAPHSESSRPCTRLTVTVKSQHSHGTHTVERQHTQNPERKGKGHTGSCKRGHSCCL